MVDGPAAEHLEVLGAVAAGRIGASGAEQVAEAGALERRLDHAAQLGGWLDAEQVEQVGSTSMAWANWWRSSPRRGDAGRPAHDARIGDAALVHLSLPTPERRVARHRPAPRVVVVGARAAQLVDAGTQLPAAGGLAVPDAGVVDRPLLTAFGAGAVVGQGDDEGVLGLSELVDEVEHPADLLVGVGKEARRSTP